MSENQAGSANIWGNERYNKASRQGGVNYVIMPNGDHVIESQYGMIVFDGGGTAIKSSIEYKKQTGGDNAY